MGRFHVVTIEVIMLDSNFVSFPLTPMPFDEPFLGVRLPGSCGFGFQKPDIKHVAIQAAFKAVQLECCSFSAALKEGSQHHYWLGGYRSGSRVP